MAEADASPGPGEEYCTECGRIVRKAAPICPHCDAGRLDERGARARMAEGPGGAPELEVSGDEAISPHWRYVIAAAPLATPLAVGAVWLLPSMGNTMAVLAFVGLFLYPHALSRDVRLVRSRQDAWAPSHRRYVLAGLTGLFTLGLLAWIVSPLYLSKRRKYLEAG